MGIRRVIITLGAKGSLLAGRAASEHVPAFAVKSIDSTGAGDAFIGSFAVFLAEGVAGTGGRATRQSVRRDFRRRAWERKNLSMIACASTRNGPRVPKN